MTAWIIAPWDKILVAGFLLLGVVMLYQGIRNFRLGLLYRQDVSRTELIEREIQGVIISLAMLCFAGGIYFETNWPIWLGLGFIAEELLAFIFTFIQSLYYEWNL